MKTNAASESQGAKFSISVQERIQEVTKRSILAILEKTEHNRDNVLGIKNALKAANISLSKNILQDEIVEKVETLLVDKADIHKACYFDYYNLLKAVKDKGTYSAWNPRTLEILTDNKRLKANAPTLISMPPLDHKTAMEVNLIAAQKKPQKIDTSEIGLLLSDIQKLNLENPEITELTKQNGILQTYYEQTKKSSCNDSIVFRQGRAIDNWNKENITKWSKAIRANPDVALHPKMLSEMLAVTARAVAIHSNYMPRCVQMLSVLMMTIGEGGGKLLQISTGEGKSTTTAMIAAVNALRGNRVDVITSSSVLASRDADEWRDFYSILNISNSHNIIEGYTGGPKDCYAKDVVYGDTLHFQSDLLRDEHKLLGTRNGRNFSNSIALVDEVDSMLIDQSGRIAKLATPIPSMEYLAPIFVTSFHYLGQMVNYFKEEEEGGGASLENHVPWMQENITSYIEKLVGIGDVLEGTERIIVPKHLQLFVEKQAPIWAKSAVQALQMSEKRDYLVIEVEGKKVIAPVDYASTGVVQERTSWMNGLHQYLQIKHNLAMSSESLTTSFISNMAYFKRYGNQIFGMSGTLGSRHEQELLKRVYDVNLAFIPTFKPKQFTQMPAIVADSTKEWHKAMIDTVKSMGQARRATLILAETIEDVEKIEQVLTESGLSGQKIHTYTRGSNTEALEVLANKAMIGDVIVATNIAGRGTDIKTSAAVELAGGLHVCLTFLPSNLRVEEQAFGRTARQGNTGSGQLILNGPYESLKLFNTTSDKEDSSLGDIDTLKQRRNIAERVRLEEIKDRLIPKIELEDRMFTRFSKLSHELKTREDNTYKLRQLEEYWGLWFKDISRRLDNEQGHDFDRNEILRSLDEFAEDMQTRYGNNSIMQNPTYLTLEAINKFGQGNSYDKSIDLLGKATDLAGEYGFAAHYNRAYGFFRKNGENLKKNHMGFVENGIEHLNKALIQLEGVVIPQLHMMQILIGDAEKNSDLSIQVSTKLNIHKLQSEYIRNALHKIEDGLSQGKVIVVNNRDTKPIFELLGQNSSKPSEEVLELSRFGTVQLFTLDAKNPPKDTWGAISMGILGISQFVVGALVTVCTGGAATALGVSMMMSGAQDLYKGVRVGMGKDVINWGDYWVNKGISYAVSIISMGWDNFKAGLSAVKEQVGKIAEASKNFFTGTATTVMGKQAATEVASSTVQKGSTATFTSIVRDFIAKEGMSRVAIEVGKAVALQNITNLAAKEISNSLTGTKEDIKEDAYNKIMGTLNSEPTSTHLNHLTSIDRINGNNYYTSQVKKAANELLAPKIDRITYLAKQLSTAAVNGMASRSSNFIAQVGMQIATKGFEMAEAANEIKSLLGEFCTELKVKITEIEQKAVNTMPQFMHQRIQGNSLDKGDINSIIEILKMNRVLRDDNIQFESRLLDPVLGFEAGIEFPGLLTPQVKDPVMLAGKLVNPPSFREVQAFQLQDLRQKNSNEEKNIEEIDFGPYRKHRGAIIKTVREINELQTADYSQEKTQLAEELAGKVTDRTMGIIRHSIITPVASPAINFSAEMLTTHLVSLVTKSTITGISAGDNDNEPLGVKDSLYLDEEQLEGIRDDINKVVKYVENEIDNICEKANLSKKDISWGRENKVEAAKAIAKWSIENPQEALSIGIDVAALAPMFKQLKMLKPMVTPQENLVFLPGEGFKLVEPISKPITMSKFEESKGGSKFDYKGVIENKTGVNKPKVLQQHGEFLSTFEKNWPELSRYTEKLPKEAGVGKYTDKGFGLKWEFTDNHGKQKYNVRIDKGDPNLDFHTQQVDHVAISYRGNVLDNTGKNYIVQDRNTGLVYKINRNIFDKGNTTIGHGFDIRSDVQKPVKHPDSHIPADSWLKWKDLFNPD